MHQFENQSQSSYPSIPVTYTVTSLGPERSNPQLVNAGVRPVPVCHGSMKSSVNIGSALSSENLSLRLASKQNTGEVDGQSIQEFVGKPRTSPGVSTHL